MKMKKFVAVAAFAFAFAFAFTASAAYDMGTTTLKRGSSGQYVSNMQLALNSCTGSALAADGAFGPNTEASVKSFQSSKSLVADGLAGNMTKAALNSCGSMSGGTTGGTTVPLCPNGMTLASNCSAAPSSNGSNLSGGAGDLSYSSTSTDVESDVKESSTENVLGVKVEADGSDISISSVKVEFALASGSGSSRPERYIDEIMVMLDDEEVGSIDASDLSRDGTTYSKSISLSGAVVDEDDEVILHIAVKTLSTVDDTTSQFDVTLTQVRWMDATGAIFSDTRTDTEEFGFDDANADDEVTIKSSSNDPDATTLLVDADTDSDEHMIGQFRLDVDDNSSDITFYNLPILLTFDDGTDTTGAADADSADNYVDELVVSVDGTRYTATLEDSEVTNGVGDAVYVIDDEFTIDAGDIVDVKIYATFQDQDGNYGTTATVYAHTEEDVDEVSPTVSWDAEGEDSLDVSGTYTGETHSLSLTGATVTGISWVKSGGGASAGSLDFFFTVEAESGDVSVTDDDMDTYDTLTTTGSTAITAAVVTLISGDATGTTDAYTVEEGATASFRVRYAVDAVTGSAEVSLTQVVGVAVPDDKQLSPTMYQE